MSEDGRQDKKESEGEQVYGVGVDRTKLTVSAVINGWDIQKWKMASKDSTHISEASNIAGIA